MRDDRSNFENLLIGLGIFVGVFVLLVIAVIVFEVAGPTRVVTSHGGSSGTPVPGINLFLIKVFSIIT